MGWFTEFCRDLGLMVHNVMHPDKAIEARKKKILRHDVEEKNQGNLVLRRTTIEEIEIKKNDPEPRQ